MLIFAAKFYHYEEIYHPYTDGSCLHRCISTDQEGVHSRRLVFNFSRRWSIKAKGYQLEKNDSWGGTTICGTGYGRMDSSRNNFISRVDSLGNPDIIFVFGGTNDAWANSPVGEYQYSDWTKEDCKNFRPALACLFDMLQKRYPKARICSLLNSELREPINESMREICKHYNIQLIELHDIDKQNGHPSISGMKSICDQLLTGLKD